MSSELIPSFETELFEAIGSFGCWQKTIFSIFFYASLVSVFFNLDITFLAPNVPFKCIVESANATILPGECEVVIHSAVNWTETISCTRWEYNSSDSNLVSQWDLVCDREWLISFAKSVYMIGFMASVFVFGQVADCLGRYPAMVISFTIACSSILFSLFSNSITSFLIFRFFQAFGYAGFTTTGFVLIMEIVGLRHRALVGVLLQIGYSLGLLVLGFIGYFIRDWFWFQVAIALPTMPIVYGFIIIPESPRWLLMNMKLQRLKKFMLTASKWNNVKVKEETSLLMMKFAKNNESEKRGTLVDLFRTQRIRGETIIMMYLWFVNCFTYYALSYNTNDLAGDPYLNFLLLGVAEIPSHLMLFWILKRFGRRKSFMVLMILSGAGCALLLPVSHSLSWVSTVLTTFSRFCVSCSFGLLYIYTGELFPTVVRNTALGFCSTVARIGSIIAPFSKELGKATAPFVPNMVTAILAISSGVCALWLPETAGRKLPDTLEEGEKDYLLNHEIISSDEL